MTINTRKSWDDYYSDIANLVAKRSTCNRARVGCVIVRDNYIVSCGYNGSLSGTMHCDDGGHLIVDGHCVRTVHAEANAIAHAARLAIECNGSTIYITHAPCWSCFKLLAMSGVCRIVYLDGRFLSDIVVDMANECGIDLVRHIQTTKE